MSTLTKIEEAQVAKLKETAKLPDFRPGDTVKVNVKVVEGDRERVQAFEGVCIARKNAGLNSSFTVRKISYGEGVERIFPLYSPRLTSVEVVRSGDVRRAKLYYLRGRRGKAARISERVDNTQAPSRQTGRATLPAHGSTAVSDVDSARRRSNTGASDLIPRPGWGGGAEHPTEQLEAGPAMPKTLFDKIWENHLVHRQDDGTCLIYIDRHLVHEVTSPQAFEGLRNSGRKVHRPHATLAVADHNVPTTDRSKGITEEESRIQVETLEQNCREFGVPYFSMDDIRQGIVHIIGPEQGLTQPGMTIVCGDSHTATHGAFGSLGLRHRHLGSRACARDPDADPAPGQEHADPGEWQPRHRRHREGHRARHHRQDRHRGRHRLCHRICGRRDPRPLDGRPHDGLQHVDRRRRPRRPDRPRRDHLRIREGPPAGAQGRRLGTGGHLLEDPAERSGCQIRHRDQAQRPPTSRRRSPGAPAPRTCCRSPAMCRTRAMSPTRTSAARWSGRWNTWA